MPFRCLLFVFLACLCTGLVHAQSSSDTLRVELPVVTILGDSRAALQRIPGSASLVTPEQIEATRPIAIEEVLRRVPGVFTRAEDGFSLRPNIGIRGLLPTRSTKVLILEDGVPLTLAPYGDPALYYHPPVERFASLEVLKGAGQIIYGPQTIGGVINYRTRMPGDGQHGFLKVVGGSRDFFDLHANVSTAWQPGAGLLMDIVRKQGNLNRENAATELTDVTLKTVVKPTATGQVVVKLNAYNEDSQVTYPGITEAMFRANPYQNPFADDNFRITRYGAHAAWSQPLASRLLLSANLYGYTIQRDWWRQGTLVLKSGTFTTDDNSANPGNYEGVSVLVAPDRNDGRLRFFRVYGLEPRVQFEQTWGRVQYTLESGLRAHYEYQHRRQLRGTAPTARTGTLVEDNERFADTYAGFMQHRVQLGPRYTLTTGLRYESMRYRRSNLLGANGLGISGRTRLSVLVPGAGFSYAPAPAWTVFTGMHRGFAPPRVEDVISNTDGAAIELDPELSWNYELGTRWNPAPGFQAEATLFRMDFENQIIAASLAGGVTSTLTNAGTTLHQGLEISTVLDGQAQPNLLRHFALNLSWTWLPTARYEGTRLSVIDPTQSVSGNRLPYAPEHLLQTGLLFRPVPKVQVLLETFFVSDQYADDLNTAAPTPNGRQGRLDAYAVWNASAEYALPRYHLHLFAAAKNLTDKVYITDRSRGIMVGTPRTLQAGLKASF